MPKTAADFLEIIKVLSRQKVAFIVVGGVCGVLHGSPVATFDLDVVHSRDPENIQKLVKALNKIEAFYRTRKEQRIIPAPEHLDSPGHHLLMTRFGPLDLLGTIGAGRRYEEVLPATVEIEVDRITFRILTLDKLIQIKKETLSEKDKIVISILERIRAEGMKKKNG
jgi:hypothetical protein